MLNRLFSLLLEHTYLRSSYLNKIFISKFKTIFIEYENYLINEYKEINEDKNIDLLRLERCLLGFYDFEEEISSFLKVYPEREVYYEYEVLELIDKYKEIIYSNCNLLAEGCKYKQALELIQKIENYVNQSEQSKFEDTKKLFSLYNNAYEKYEETKDYYFNYKNLEIFENKKKLNLYIKAKAGHEEYECLVGSIMINENQSYLPYLPNLGVKFLASAANKGNPDAQYRLSLCYIEGIGVEKSRHNSIYWMKQAAYQGHVEAKKIVRQYNL